STRALAIMLLYFVLGFSAFIIYRLVKYYRWVARYPKGPIPLPFIGNMHQINFQAQYKSYGKMGKENAPIYTVFAPLPLVHITDYALLKEAFVEKGDDFVGRPEFEGIQEFLSFGPNTGVINSNGDSWRENRRAAVSILRDFGMGKNTMEEQVRSCVADFIAHLDKIEDKTNVDMRWPIQVMVANVINETLFGYRHEYGNCQLLMDYVIGFTIYMDSLVTEFGLLIALIFPNVMKWPLIKSYTLGRLEKLLAEINKYIIENTDKCLAGYNVEDEPTCFVHAYKQRMGENEYLTQTNLLGTCGDFFMAGQETTTTTLRWAMLFFAKHQDKQDRLRAEIFDIVGHDRLPNMADQVKMPYARACVLEVQRRANILQTNVQRVATRDVEVGGYKIPKGAWVNGDIHYLMANDPLFENPEEFSPERYLNEDGKTLRKDLVDRTLPFSIGKRACAGEGIARVELFIGLTATIQNYRILPCEGKEIDLERPLHTIIMPREQNLRLEKMIP
ncbi:hypothetical protein PFISCL1PPCAC_14002, partial [Pristionchus fissidentatus]